MTSPDQKLIDARFEICSTCPKLAFSKKNNSLRCKASCTAGCALPLYANLVSGQCPLFKFDAIKSGIDTDDLV